MDGSASKCVSSRSLLAALDDSKTMSLQRVLTAPILVEIRLALPAIAEELGCETDDLWITDAPFVCLYSNSHGTADRPIKATGHDIVPFVAHGPLHHKEAHNGPGWGVVYYYNEESKVTYAIYAQQGSYGDIKFLIVKKGQVYRLARAANRQRKENVREIVAPVLAPGVLTAVMENTIGFLQHGKDISKYGVRVRQGLLLTGPPGNGKTMLCRYLQKMSDRYSYGWDVISASQIDKSYAEGHLGRLFNSYPMTFFDDIDISYLHRDKGRGAVACAILSAMDGVVEVPHHHLVRVFTTNEDIKAMDEAFSRPGRIDGIIKIDRPDPAMRSQLVAGWHEEIQDALDIEAFVEETDGMTFAELEGIKALLVTAKVVRNAGWDMDRALKEFKERRIESENFKIHGFHGLTKKERRLARQKLKPPVQIGDDELDRSVDTDKPVKDCP